MARFRRKRHVVRAEQYLKDLVPPMGVCINPYCDGRITKEVNGEELGPHVHTAHNNQIVVLAYGDWVVPEADGKHFYLIRDSDMQRLYDRVEEP